MVLTIKPVAVHVGVTSQDAMTQCQSTLAKKVCQNDEQASQIAETKEEIEKQKEITCQANLIQKELKEKLKGIHGKGDGAKKVSKHSFQAESSSSGCVKARRCHLSSYLML
jgi:hypothetical protein